MDFVDITNSCILYRQVCSDTIYTCEVPGSRGATDGWPILQEGSITHTFVATSPAEDQSNVGLHDAEYTETVRQEPRDMPGQPRHHWRQDLLLSAWSGTQTKPTMGINNNHI